MFRLFLVFSLMFCALTAHSQNSIDITSCPDTVMVNSNIPCYGFLVHFTNNDSLPINVAVIDSANYQLPGTTQMVTFNGCASPIPGQPETIFIEPSDTLWAQFIYFPNGQSGTSSVDICFFDFNNSSDTVCSTIVIDTSPFVSTADIENTNFVLRTYPNPFSDQLFIEYDINLGNSANVLITDIHGKLIYSQRLNPSEKQSILSFNPEKGIYFVSLVLNGTPVHTEQIIKQ